MQPDELGVNENATQVETLLERLPSALLESLSFCLMALRVLMGKRNGIYDEPRKIVESIPGASFVELDRSRERSLCCEGGGECELTFLRNAFQRYALGMPSNLGGGNVSHSMSFLSLKPN